MSESLLERQYVAGLDLGLLSDHTAYAVFERTREKEVRKGVQLTPVGEYKVPDKTWKYTLKRMDRWDIGTSYTDIAAWLGKAYSRSVEEGGFGGTTLAIDKTGVGNAVLEMIQTAMSKYDAKVKLRPISITGGSTVNPDGAGWKVPKKELVSILQSVMGTGRIKVKASLPNCGGLLKEFENFKVKMKETGHEEFGEWRTGQHDDMVLACAIGLWVGERGIQKAWVN